MLLKCVYLVSRLCSHCFSVCECFAYSSCVAAVIFVRSRSAADGGFCSTWNAGVRTFDCVAIQPSRVAECFVEIDLCTVLEIAPPPSPDPFVCRCGGGGERRNASSVRHTQVDNCHIQWTYRALSFAAALKYCVSLLLGSGHCCGNVVWPFA